MPSPFWPPWSSLTCPSCETNGEREGETQSCALVFLCKACDTQASIHRPWKYAPLCPSASRLTLRLWGCLCSMNNFSYALKLVRDHSHGYQGQPSPLRVLRSTETTCEERGTSRCPYLCPQPCGRGSLCNHSVFLFSLLWNPHYLVMPQPSSLLIIKIRPSWGWAYSL